MDREEYMAAVANGVGSASLAYISQMTWGGREVYSRQLGQHLRVTGVGNVEGDGRGAAGPARTLPV